MKRFWFGLNAMMSIYPDPNKEGTNTYVLISVLYRNKASKGTLTELNNQ